MTRSFARLACLVSVVWFGGCATSDSPSVGQGSGGSNAGPGTGGSSDAPPASGSGGANSDGGGGSGGASGDATSGSGGAPVPDPSISSEGDGDRVIGPGFTRDPLAATRVAGAMTSRSFSFTMTAAQSMIYKGVNGAWSRSIRVYVPQQYDPAKPAALLVTQDAQGGNYLPVAIDNLIFMKQVPVIVTMLIPNGGGDSVGSERGLEYDTVSGLYAEFVMKEVLPLAIAAAKTQLNIDLKITDNPEGHATLGGSSGGAAAFSMAWWHPDLFRRVIAWSGTYVTQVPAGSPFPHGCWIYHDVDPYDATKPNGLIVQHCEPATGFVGDSNPGSCDTPLTQAKCEAVAGCAWNTVKNRPVRAWLQSSQNDLGAGGAPSSYRNFDLANQRMAAALKMRGYHYHYDHANGANHNDGNVQNQTAVEALKWVWRGYPL